MSGKRPVSVIVLVWNGLDVTRRCISSLLEVTEHPGFEVVVVDNGSTDGTLDYLRGEPGIRLMENSENLGFVKGNNRGIEQTSGDIVLLNNDTEIIQADWLVRMEELAYSREDIGIVGCRLVNGKGELVQAGTYMPLPSFWGQEYPGGEKDISQYTRDREVEGVIFACAYIKRELIDRVGALDEDYFAYYEDTDYCLKAKKEGYRTFCCGGVTVKHLENASTDVNRMDFSSTFRKSRETFIGKWKPFYDTRFTSRLTWHSYISGDDIFSKASASLLWALERAGVDLNLEFLEGAEKAELSDFRINDMKNRPADRDRPQVIFAPPEMLGRASGSYNIGYTFTPFDIFKPSWVKEMNRLDEIWVPSDFQKLAAESSGVKRPVRVMPFGIDDEYFNPGITPFSLSGRYTFLSRIEWGWRFASGTLLRAFTEEFSDNEKAVLVMMVNAPGTGAEVEEEVEAMNLAMDRAPVVFVMDHEVPPYQDGSLYRSCDCCVLPVRSSEAGSTIVEAVACGTPVITTMWGSMATMVDGKSVLGVDADEVQSHEEGLKLAEPRKDALRAMLRKAYSGAQEMKASGMELSRRLSRELCWDAVASRMVKAIDGRS